MAHSPKYSLAFFFFLTVDLLTGTANSFSYRSISANTSRSGVTLLLSAPSHAAAPSTDRRSFIASAALILPASLWILPASASVDSLRTDLKQAREQMSLIPDLIKAEKWDSVRAVLVKPPLSDLWTKSARKQPLLMEYAEAVGENPTGDELAVLESKEELQSHLRYLDMAVYNNVFNPIKTEGENGATKELIRSYREDPTNEFKASVAALDELIQLGSNLN